MLDFSHSLIICPSFFLLISFVAVGEGDVVIGVCEWVKNPYVKECTLSLTTPKALSFYVEPCSICDVGSAMVHRFSTEWLQGGLDSYIVADFTHEVCCYVSYLIVAN